MRKLNKKIAKLEKKLEKIGWHGNFSTKNRLLDSRARIQAKLSKLIEKRNNTSDGYHTFEDLYDHSRANFIIAWLLLAKLEDFDCWWSMCNSDGVPNENGWLTVGIDFKGKKGYITYHIETACCTAIFTRKDMQIEKGRWDGHSSHDVQYRLIQIGVRL